VTSLNTTTGELKGWVRMNHVKIACLTYSPDNTYLYAAGQTLNTFQNTTTNNMTEHAAIIRINVATQTVTYIGVTQSPNPFFYDLSTIYEDPYFQGGNFVGLLQTGTTNTAFDTVLVVKVDINDTMTYPNNTQVISNYLIKAGAPETDKNNNGPPIGLIIQS
jgi:hypothetical protein